MANENYRILDERDLNNFKAGDNLSFKKEGNKIVYAHTGSAPEYTTNEIEQPGTLEWGKEYSIQIPNDYDNKGHVDSMRNWTFTMPLKPETGVTELPSFGENKNYGWSATELGKPSDTNNEGETYNAQLDWGDTIRVPNFYVDEKGRVEKGWTAGYILPEKQNFTDFLSGDGIEIKEDGSVNLQNISSEATKEGAGSGCTVPILVKDSILLYISWQGGMRLVGSADEVTDKKLTLPGGILLPSRKILSGETITSKFIGLSGVDLANTFYFNLTFSLSVDGYILINSNNQDTYLATVCGTVVL